MKKKKKKRARTSPKRSHEEHWSDLTWADLNDWAGSRAVTRGRSYQNRGSVHELGMSPDGELVAWVVGGSRYATRVRCEPPGPGGPGPSRLASSCSCPVGTRCKHAVAVVVAVLEGLEAGEEIQQAVSDDVRWDIAIGAFAAATLESASKPSSVEPYLRSLKKAQLVELLLQVSAVHPDVKADIVHRRALAGGDVVAIVQRIRAEIATVSKQEAWSDSWSGEGEIPDYSRVESGLKSLVDGAYHDAVVELGHELFQAGQDQVGRSRDDGETGMAIADCMAIVFRAVLKSSLSDPEKILYAIDLSLADDYGLAESIERIVDRKWSRRTWSAVADVLVQRLESGGSSGGTDFHSRYHRDRLSRWVIAALEAAGREEEATGVCESEAVRTASYERLVRRLMDGKRLDEATQWAERGYAAVLDESPGSASGLRTLLRDIARRRRRWPLVAAYEAERFFERPDVSRLKELLAAAMKAGCESGVRKATLRFLETGRRPAPSGKWPLPPTQLPSADPPDGRASEPVKHWDVLRDLAIEEDRPDDVLRWHDRLAPRGRSSFWRSDDVDLRVARAVSSTHPERAIDMYHAAALKLIERANPDAYVEAGGLLRRVGELLHTSKRSSEWPALIAEVRESHRRKRRLMEVLDGLEGQPIVRARRAGGSRNRSRSRP